MRSKLVILACERTIAHILTERENRITAGIAQRLTYTKFSIWKMKRIPEYTLEDATMCAREEAKMFPYAWGDLAHAKKLLTLAKKGNPVVLNEEDTRVLF